MITCSYMMNIIILLMTSMIIPQVDGLQPATTVMANYSKDAISLFNNMRTPAALVAGGLVPLGILMNKPIVEEEDTIKTKVLKKSSALLGVASLLSEIIAVIYASIAINKLVELPSPQTASVVDLLSQNHNLPWLGANVHFFLGMMGFSLLVGTRVYLVFGGAVGNLAIGYSVAFFLQMLAVVNRGIALGRGGSHHFGANNFGHLCLLYGLSILRFATKDTTSVCSILSIGVTAVTIANTIVSFYKDYAEASKKKKE